MRRVTYNEEVELSELHDQISNEQLRDNSDAVSDTDNSISAEYTSVMDNEYPVSL